MAKAPDQLAIAAAMKSVGYSIPLIVQRTGISRSTLIRHLSTVKKGNVSLELVASARADLIADTSFSDGIKAEIACYMLNELQTLNALRDAGAVILDDLMAQPAEATYKARALAALTVSAITQQKAYRLLLQVDSQPIEQESLPNLFISELTIEEIERMRLDQLELEELTRPAVEDAIIEWD